MLILSNLIPLPIVLIINGVDITLVCLLSFILFSISVLTIYILIYEESSTEVENDADEQAERTGLLINTSSNLPPPYSVI